MTRSRAAKATAHKPTFASVTTKPCTCNWPLDVSREPYNSVHFDEATGEYEFLTQSGGKLNIYHCPFCGGAMPRSRRGELFAYISEAEVARLDELTRGLSSVEEAVRILGRPDTDMAAGMRERTPARGRRPPRVSTHRVLTFSRLSDTADVQLIDSGLGIRFSYIGKYLGARKKRPQNKRMQLTRSALAKGRRGPRS